MRSNGRSNQESDDQENVEEEIYQGTSDYRQQKRTDVDVFAQPVQKANLWLKQVMDETGLDDQHHAYTALKSVLHTLRDRLTAEEAVDLASQLPALIRGVYFEGWKPSGKPIKYGKDGFINTVHGHFIDVPGMNPTEVIRGVFRVLRSNIAEVEIDHVIATMPEEFAELWMEEAFVK